MGRGKSTADLFTGVIGEKRGLAGTLELEIKQVPFSFQLLSGHPYVSDDGKLWRDTEEPVYVAPAPGVMLEVNLRQIELEFSAFWTGREVQDFSEHIRRMRGRITAQVLNPASDRKWKPSTRPEAVVRTADDVFPDDVFLALRDGDRIPVSVINERGERKVFRVGPTGLHLTEVKDTKIYDLPYNQLPVPLRPGDIVYDLDRPRACSLDEIIEVVKNKGTAASKTMLETLIRYKEDKVKYEISFMPRPVHVHLVISNHRSAVTRVVHADDPVHALVAVDGQGWEIPGVAKDILTNEHKWTKEVGYRMGKGWERAASKPFTRLQAQA